ncbi:MAG: HAD-IIIC family phosphatase [bacterium]
MVTEILRELKPTPAGYAKAASQIESGDFDALAPMNVGVLATFTLDLLRPYLIVEGAARGLRVNPWFAPFDQIEQQILDGGSDFYQSRPDAAVIAMRLEDIAPNLAGRFIPLSPEEVEAELEGIESRVRGLIAGLRRHTSAEILVFNFAPPEALDAGLADPFLEPSQSSAHQRANERVAAACRETGGAHVFDCARLAAEFGLDRLRDPKMFYLGRVPFGAEAHAEMGRRLARCLRALALLPCKCLVVDLDNTLWGGVLGEEGPEGIALGEDYPGAVYKDFQRRLLALRDRGVLLAVASKNNEADVLEVFEKNPDCLLGAEHFSALQIHWRDKAGSLRAIAKELNIGTDALAFFDDDPLEREWVRSQLPEVNVIAVPEDALGYRRALEDSGAFDRLSLSAEDLGRAELYRRENERKQLKTEAPSLEEFLSRLDIRVSVGPVGKDTLLRVGQLLMKTNQFNLTTRRHTESELQEMIGAGAVALWARVSDRYGDSGLVGVGIAVPGGSVPEKSAGWRIDTFLMSCRVLGRKVEGALLSALSRRVGERGGQSLLGEFIPTAKNALAADFYPSHGFAPVAGEKNIWKIDLSTGGIPIPDYVSVSFNGDPAE